MKKDDDIFRAYEHELKDIALPESGSSHVSHAPFSDDLNPSVDFEFVDPEYFHSPSPSRSRSVNAWLTALFFIVAGIALALVMPTIWRILGITFIGAGLITAGVATYFSARSGNSSSDDDGARL